MVVLMLILTVIIVMFLVFAVTFLIAMLTRRIWPGLVLYGVGLLVYLVLFQTQPLGELAVGNWVMFALGVVAAWGGGAAVRALMHAGFRMSGPPPSRNRTPGEEKGEAADSQNPR
ncbi:MAG: hypothetical protein IMW91_07510 [Firmicutes bacterium]|nr:hypothetical protein [Bacillota bacterium]